MNVNSSGTVKMRGLPTGSPLDDGYFIVMDRLYGTLAERIQVWSDQKVKSKGKVFGFGSNKVALEHLLRERMTIAYDLAAAFWYLHQKK